MKAIVTGSGGLIGSQCARMLAGQGWDVLGIDNDLRQFFFGASGSTAGNVHSLLEELPTYRHLNLDIRDREAIRTLFREQRPDFVIHAAAQPSHDKAASIPYEDFDVNAVGTLNMLVAARDYCPESPFCFTSTNKVYGDRPNDLRLVELEKRYDFADDQIDRRINVDRSMLAFNVRSVEGRGRRNVPGIRALFRNAGGNLPRRMPHRAAARAVECTGTLPTSCTARSPANRTRSTGTRESRSATRSTRRTWRASSWSSSATHAAARCTTSGGGRANSLSILETVDVLAGARLPLAI